MHLPNAIVQESVRAFWSGWYGDLVTALPVIERRDGVPPGGPGLGPALRPEVFERADAQIRSTSKGGHTSRAGTTVSVMQEDWGVFRNLPATAARFTELTGVEVEVTLTVIPEMWELMERSFSGEDPPFDLVGVDDLLLIQAARAGHVVPLDDLIAADGYSLDDFPEAALARAERRRAALGSALLGVSNVLIYRADLFESTASPCPRRWTS